MSVTMTREEREQFLTGVHVGVTVEGPVSAEEKAGHEERLDLARRYLGPEGGNAYG